MGVEGIYEGKGEREMVFPGARTFRRKRISSNGDVGVNSGRESCCEGEVRSCLSGSTLPRDRKRSFSTTFGRRSKFMLKGTEQDAYASLLSRIAKVTLEAKGTSKRVTFLSLTAAFDRAKRLPPFCAATTASEDPSRIIPLSKSRTPSLQRLMITMMIQRLMITMMITTHRWPSRRSKRRPTPTLPLHQRIVLRTRLERIPIDIVRRQIPKHVRELTPVPAASSGSGRTYTSGSPRKRARVRNSAVRRP
ncbi:hypothetical protein KC365_g2 [Hortaea werneckii]|nr:hypothetical protein KC339_g2 [Hortaea werneckii]KAI7245895.1 hypothetical protein KC365_g2 [Hortaea werneckii]